jgi:hypothetical protein
MTNSVTSEDMKRRLARSRQSIEARLKLRRPTIARWSRMVLTIALLALPSACRQIVDFEDGPDSNNDGYISSTGYWPFSDAECGACVDQNCAAEAKACLADPSCQAFEGCIAACKRGDSACTDSCGYDVLYSGLSPEKHHLAHCQAAACTSQCPTFAVQSASGQSCGGLGAPRGCQACCCDEFAACDADPECVSQTACWRQCGYDDPLGRSCFEACMGGPVDALNANLPPIRDCLFGSSTAPSRCQSQCFASADWSCLGKVQWPGASVGWNRVYGNVYDIPSLNPLANFRVRGCVPRDCVKPFAETYSDADGNVSLDISQNFFGTTAYLEVTAPSGPGPDYPKHLFFEPTDALNHSSRWDLAVYIRESVDSVPLPDPQLGGLLFFTHDCSGGRAAGVEVSASNPGTSDPPAYQVPGLKSNPNDTATLDSGIGIIINLPPGQQTLTSRRQGSEQLIGTQVVVIEADAMTIVDLVPTPL